MASLGIRIKKARLAKGLSQPELARAAGVSKGAISQWEADQVQEIKAVYLYRAARALRVDMGWLLEGNGDEPPESAIDHESQEMAQQIAALPQIARERVSELISALSGMSPALVQALFVPADSPEHRAFYRSLEIAQRKTRDK